MNPFDAIATLILGKIKEGIYTQWLRFIFELGFSAGVSFLFVCGATLVATKSPALSTGSGMIASAVSLTVLFRRESTRLTKGFLVVLPAEEATKELETNLQMIQKEK